MYKINEESLQKAIEYVIRRAEGWQPIGSGECQLYGKYDDERIIRELFVADFIGHNSRISGPGIVQITSYPWFSWYENEDLAEWLQDELDGESELKEKFCKWLRETKEILVFSEVSHFLLVDLFKKFDQEKWEQLMEEWKETWLEHYIPEQVFEVKEMLQTDYEPWDINDDVPPAVLEWDK